MVKTSSTFRVPGKKVDEDEFSIIPKLTGEQEALKREGLLFDLKKPTAPTQVSSPAVRPLTQEEQVLQGNAFIRERERLKSQGFSQSQAVQQAGAAVQGQRFTQRTQENVLQNRARFEQALAQPELPIEKGLGINFAEVALSGIESAAFGAAPGVISGNTALAIGGGALGALHGIVRGLQKEAQQDAAIKSAEFSQSIRNIRAVTNAANKGLPGDWAELYGREIAKINLQERELKEASSDLNNYLSNARVKLTRIESWNQGERITWDSRIREAVSAPNPNIEFPIEDILEENL